MITNIWAVGRNYADHAKELGNEVPKEPMIFLKAGSSSIVPGKILELPNWSSDIQHEAELAVRFGRNLEIESAAVALDLTARDVQSQLKKAGHPWTLAKSFKQSCPLGTFFNVTPDIDLQNLTIRLTLNGEIRQNGSTAQMVFPVAKLVHYVKERFPVQPGDLLLTGTPAGVSPLKSGDHVRAEIVGKSVGEWSIA